MEIYSYIQLNQLQRLTLICCAMDACYCLLIYFKYLLFIVVSPPIYIKTVVHGNSCIQLANYSSIDERRRRDNSSRMYNLSFVWISIQMMGQLINIGN